MLKTFGLIAVCFVIASYGFAKYEKLLFRKRYLTELVMFAEGCTQFMRVENCNIFVIFQKYRFENLSFFKEITPVIITDREQMKALFVKNGVTDRDIRFMCDFVMQLGVGDIESQEKYCRSFSTVFNGLLSDAEQEVNGKGKLHRSLCLLAAVGVFIIFI